MDKTKKLLKQKGSIILPLVLLMLSGGLHAQTVFQGGDYWSFDAGFGMTDILVKGLSYQFVLDPKISISPPLMAGNRLGVNYSTDKILTFENQIYLRWNFLRFGRPERTVNVFVQGGIGLLASYRGENGFFSDLSKRRGSFMVDAAAGVTIPLGSSWHIEPAVRGGYPHIAGASVTIGKKMPFRADREKQISPVKSVMFGAYIGEYNVDVDNDTMKQNEQAVNEIAKTLSKNPGYHVRIEGHANPVLNVPSENDSLMTLSKSRADAISALLKEKGVKEEQMVIIAYGGARPVTCDKTYGSMNRRVELIIYQDK